MVLFVKKSHGRGLSPSECQRSRDADPDACDVDHDRHMK